MSSQDTFHGVQVGQNGVYGCSVARSGKILVRGKARFRVPGEFPHAYQHVVSQLGLKEGTSAPVVGLEKLHRSHIPSLAPPLPPLFQPALASSLLGAIPNSPGLLLNLGREIRIAALDSTHSYREFRFLEGGGEWWQRELTRLSEHSTRLQLHLRDFSTELPPLKFVPRLLELGQFPTPDPVLKPKLEKVASQIARMVSVACARLPGLRAYSVAGFLAESALGELVVSALEESSPHLKHQQVLFAPEIGSALMALALDLENREREHLGKDPFQIKVGPDTWAPPPALVRRLYRTRRPFQDQRL